MPTRRRELYTHHLPALFWMALLTVALLVPPSPDLPDWLPRVLHFKYLDKVVHGAMFLAAGVLVARSFGRLRRIRFPALAACALLCAYGLASEVAQHVWTARNGEVADAAADVAGATAGAGLVALAAALRPPRSGARPGAAR